MASVILNKNQQILTKYNRDSLIFPHEEKFVVEDLNNSQNNLVELLDEDDLDQDQEVNQRLIGNFCSSITFIFIKSNYLYKII